MNIAERVNVLTALSHLGFAYPVCKLQLLVTHGYSFYGSSLWNFCDNACNELYNT